MNAETEKKKEKKFSETRTLTALTYSFTNTIEGINASW